MAQYQYLQTIYPPLGPRAGLAAKREHSVFIWVLFTLYLCSFHTIGQLFEAVSLTIGSMIRPGIQAVNRAHYIAKLDLMPGTLYECCDTDCTFSVVMDFYLKGHFYYKYTLPAK